MGSAIMKERSDYASVKRRLAHYIEDTIMESEEPIKLNALYLHAMRHFGLGRRVVDDYIELMRRARMVKVDSDMEEVCRP